MIVNVTMYLDIDGKFSPEQGRQVAVGVRREFIKDIVKIVGNQKMVYKDSSNGSSYPVVLLSEDQAIQRFKRGGPSKLPGSILVPVGD